MIDGHGREIGDLRVSVTDRCNFRCQYCMPAEGLPWLERAEILTFEEIARLVALFAEMGVSDVRLTGGEPLVRREFPVLAGMLAEIEGVHELSVTTNGFLLARDAENLVRAGIDRFNVSVDSLQRDRFYELTRRDALDAGAARARDAGPVPRGPPDQGQRGGDTRLHRGGGAALRRAGAARRPYEVRFIEFMPLDADHAWNRSKVLTGAEIREAIERRLSARARAARAQRHRPGLPLRRQPRPDRVHQPGVRAVLRRLQPGPAHRRRPAADLPLLPQRDRPARAAARQARPTTSSRRSSAPRCGARSSSTTSASRASSSPLAACPPSAANPVPRPRGARK